MAKKKAAKAKTSSSQKRGIEQYAHADKQRVTPSATKVHFQEVPTAVGSPWMSVIDLSEGKKRGRLRGSAT